MLISPVLNLVIRSLTKNQFRLFLAVLFLIFGVIPVASLGYDVMRISTGHHFSWMIVLYLIGGYIRTNVPILKAPARKYLAGYFLFAAIHLLYKLLTAMVGLQSFSDLLLTYPSPLVVGEAICLFLYFKNAFSSISGNSIFGKLIHFTAPGVYSVYVIHVHPKVYWNTEIIAFFRSWDDWNTLTVCVTMVIAAAALFTFCVCLDAVRQRIFRRCGIDRIIYRSSIAIENKLRSLLGG